MSESEPTRAEQIISEVNMGLFTEEELYAMFEAIDEQLENFEEDESDEPEDDGIYTDPFEDLFDDTFDESDPEDFIV